MKTPIVLFYDPRASSGLGAKGFDSEYVRREFYVAKLNRGHKKYFDESLKNLLSILPAEEYYDIWCAPWDITTLAFYPSNETSLESLFLKNSKTRENVLIGGVGIAKKLALIETLSLGIYSHDHYAEIISQCNFCLFANFETHTWRLYVSDEGMFDLLNNHFTSLSPQRPRGLIETILRSIGQWPTL